MDHVTASVCEESFAPARSASASAASATARTSPAYWTWLTEGRSLAAAMETAAIRDGEAILEVAVGTGVVFRELLRRNPSGKTVGVDLTPEMLRRARRKAERTGVPFTLQQADARTYLSTTAPS